LDTLIEIILHFEDEKLDIGLRSGPLRTHEQNRDVDRTK